MVCRIFINLILRLLPNLKGSLKDPTYVKSRFYGLGYMACFGYGTCHMGIEIIDNRVWILVLSTWQVRSTSNLIYSLVYSIEKSTKVAVPLDNLQIYQFLNKCSPKCLFRIIIYITSRLHFAQHVYWSLENLADWQQGSTIVGCLVVRMDDTGNVCSSPVWLVSFISLVSSIITRICRTYCVMRSCKPKRVCRWAEVSPPMWHWIRHQLAMPNFPNLKVCKVA